MSLFFGCSNNENNNLKKELRATSEELQSTKKRESNRKIFESYRNDILMDIDLIQLNISDSLRLSNSLNYNERIKGVLLANSDEIHKALSDLTKSTFSYLDNLDSFRNSIKPESSIIAASTSFKSISGLRIVIEKKLGSLIAELSIIISTHPEVADSDVQKAVKPLKDALEDLKNLEQDLTISFKTSARDLEPIR